LIHAQAEKVPQNDYSVVRLSKKSALAGFF
jgi:hypothetical protein